MFSNVTGGNSNSEQNILMRPYILRPPLTTLSLKMTPWASWISILCFRHISNAAKQLSESETGYFVQLRIVLFFQLDELFSILMMFAIHDYLIYSPEPIIHGRASDYEHCIQVLGECAIFEGFLSYLFGALKPSCALCSCL